jgi:DNA-directed RNA polymerase II subunit RPB2
MGSTEKIIWNIIDKYFNSSDNLLVKHHIDSYNDFFNNKINNIFREKNPIYILKNQDTTTKEYNYKAEIYLAGKTGNRIYYGKPIIFDNQREHYMFPNEARLRNMSYSITIHIDVEIEYKIKKEDGSYLETNSILEKIYLGKFPIMINSDLCILNGLDKEVKFMMGECKNDKGGYFIIDGKEKVIINQEKFADNMLYVKDNYSEIYSHSAEIRSVSEDSSKPIRSLSIRIVSPNEKHSNNQIVVNVPNVRKPVPLFILMRALGIESDKEIIKYCLLDLEKNDNYINYFIPSVHDSGNIYNQETALKYMATLTKQKTVPHILEILTDYLLPHIGEMNFINKAYYLGYMVFELLKVFSGEKLATDRDSFKYKRVELTGRLIYDLFREYYTLQQKHIYLKIDKEYHYKQSVYQDVNFISLIENNYQEIFRERILEKGFRKAFKGSWGAEEHTRRPEVVQDLNRLSYNSFISHLRKLNLPLDSSAKVVGPRLLHSSQWGIIDPVDTPDGGNVGLHKHLSLGAHITSGYSSKLIIDFLRSVIFMELLEECSTEYISKCTKIIVNGSWVGIIPEPVEVLKLLKQYRRIGLIPIYTSISWIISDNIIYINTDSGRICRPIFYITDNNEPSYSNEYILKRLIENNFTYDNLLIGFNEIKIDKSINSFINDYDVYYKFSEVYGSNKNLPELYELGGIIDYLDSSETETSMIVNSEEDIIKTSTHIEIHGSLLLGVMGNQIVFPENNQLPRDLFSCGQSKQGVSLYNSNYQNRIDKMGVVLNNGQIPLVKSRYLKYIYNEEHPYGINAIVAIGCYGGYNVEDSILFNEGSIKRGMFNTTYLNMYESREESSKVGSNTIDSKFANIEKFNVINKKPGYSYSELDDNGLIQENVQLDDKKVIIGKITNDLNNDDTFIDSSITPKKGQLGFVDKSFITEGEEGFRIAKVRIREERTPAMGDKFCSRCGQKGTVGLIIPENNMPFTENGIRPDLIINPHALPSRMTIGQLVETLMGKGCAILGGFGDCTAFNNKGPQHEIFGNILNNIGYSSTGNEILYNGETGEQLNMELFIGPCYYMRLKHMVKDKINYRARGPRTVLTRQTVQGRANDGGLRIGEMERDGIIAHGASYFLQESMLVRGDDYYVAICNKTGTISIYNKEKNIFISPHADGPIKFNSSIDNGNNIEIITKYGRSFSIIRVPYAFKLLMQELQTMNVQMRIITEDNIDQIHSMNFTKSIDLYEKLELLNKDNKNDDTNITTEKNKEENNILNNVSSIITDTVNKLFTSDKKEGQDEGEGEDEDDNSGLSDVTIQSIKKAEEEAKRMEEEEDMEDEIPELNIGEEIDKSQIDIESLDKDITEDKSKPSILDVETEIDIENKDIIDNDTGDNVDIDNKDYGSNSQKKKTIKIDNQ